MASIWRLLTSGPGRQVDGDASRTQSSSVRPQRVKKDLHRRRSLAGLFTSPPPKEPEYDITSLTCEERIHYPLYNPRDPRHNSEYFAYARNSKGIWANYGQSIRSRLQGPSKSGVRSPNFQKRNPHRSIRSRFVSFTGSSRLMKRLSRSESPSKPHMSSLWEPERPSRISSREKASSNSLLDRIDNPQFSPFPEARSVPLPCLLPSLPSMSSGLMSPLELEACTAGGFIELETSHVQNHDTRPHTFNPPLQPFHILRNAVSSMSSGHPLNQGYPGFTNTSNSRYQKGSSPVPIMIKRPPLRRQEARVANEGDNPNFPTFLSKQLHSHSSDLDNRKEDGETKSVENLATGRRPQSLLNLGEQWLETRKQQVRVVSPGVSQPSTATDSEFGVDIYRTSAKHCYASATDSDVILSSWLSSLSCASHTRDNTDISGSTLCRSSPPATRHPSRVGQTRSGSTLVSQLQGGNVKGSSRSGTRDCTGLVTNGRVARDTCEEASAKSNSPQPGTIIESERVEKPIPLDPVSNIPPEAGRVFEMPKAPLNLHLNSPGNPSQLSKSLREPLCESDLKTGANKAGPWPSSIDSRIENGNLNQLPQDHRQLSLAVDGHDTESRGNVEFIRKCRNIPVSHAEENRTPGCSGNAKTRSASQDATNRRIGGLDTGEKRSKSSSNRKDGTSSCSGSGSGGSGQSDPLTNSTAGTSIVDNASDQNLAAKVKAKNGAARPGIGIKVLPTNGDAILLKN
ncbi:hypothetical protein ACJ72_05878 [Emergomyces africanus]|uniref:Uncharacterized protein n=1 Tax=Emergomyces africanus TaxID=1955775 RepID=A0A1B7NSW9_9EURO|nr:hypothetical protein ACJ72_05878 [Emergomyces africanus]